MISPYVNFIACLYVQMINHPTLHSRLRILQKHYDEGGVGVKYLYKAHQGRAKYNLTIQCGQEQLLLTVMAEGSDKGHSA